MATAKVPVPDNRFCPRAMTPSAIPIEYRNNGRYITYIMVINYLYKLMERAVSMINYAFMINWLIQVT